VCALESRLLPSVNVLTYHNDLGRTGDNLNETQLTPANVNAGTFGQLFSYPVDGQIYGQPLVLTGVNIPGQGTHDIVFVTTEHDSIYAFDANSNAGANAAPLWYDSFIDAANGITTVPSFETGSADITPEIGITATPAIDPVSGTIYVVSKTQESRADGFHWVQKLHALDVATGAEKLGGPVLLGDTVFNFGPDNGFTDVTPIFVPGTGDSSNGNGTVFFNALRENERDGLFLSGGVLYMSFTSHGDTQPYHGWLVGVNPQTLQVESVYNTTPNGTEGAIWMGGGSPAVDANGNIYFSTGNGTFDRGSTGPTALGPAGGGLGYGPDFPGGGGGLNNSVAVKFDLFNNAGEGDNSTGLYTNGASPTVPAIDLSPSGINLQNSDLMRATLNYDGTTLTETLTDTFTGATFSTSYAVNIAQTVGGNTAFVGFTGGTGGLTAAQDVQSWTFNNGATTTIDHSAGFANNTDLTANGSASFPGTSAQLTDGGFFEAGSVFTNTRVNVTNFSTTFTFVQQPGTFPMADGMTFCIENATPGPDQAMSVVKVSPTPGPNNVLPVQDFFTPFNQAALSGADLDQGSGGVLLLPDQTTGPTHLLVQGGKEGSVFLINRDNMGGFSTTGNNVVQELPPGTIGGGSFDTPAYFNNGTQQLIYLMGSADVLKAFTLSNGQLSTTPFAQTSQNFGFPGATPSISANGTQNGIAWVADVHKNGTGGHPNSGPAVLHAYDATTLQELYNSSQLGTVDQLGNAVKFVVPTIANGKVYIGTQTGLYVFGLFSPGTSTPAAASNLTATPLSATSIALSWTNNATNARAIKILRSTGKRGSFMQIAEVNRNTTTFTDTGLQPSTTYTYEIVPTNALGDGQAVPATATTRIRPSVLTVAGTGSSEVDLSWDPTANQLYVVSRSTDGVNFTQIARLKVDQTSFEDTGLAAGVYFYEVEGFDVDGETATSNVVFDTVGEPVSVNDGAGFASTFDLTANNGAAFVTNPSTTTPVLQLTDGINFDQDSSVFTSQQADIRRFTTTFTFQMSGGTVPFGADGLAFVVQSNSPTALGFAGGGLGAEGINNSVAVAFRAFAFPGLFINGQFVPSSTTELQENGFPVSSTDLDPSGINFNIGAINSPPDIYRATLSYDGATLSETLTDISTGATFSTSYVVDIQSLVGGQTAFVGLTGADGFFTLNQQVQTWTFTSSTQTLAPLAPTDLQVKDVSGHDANRSDVTIAWTRHSFNETGYQVFRSTDGVNFSALATLPANSDTFTDSKVQPGTYFYRVLAFNANGNSAFTNADGVIVGTPGQTTRVDHSAGFASNAALTANGNAAFTGTVAELTDGGFDERGSVFTNARVGVTNFTTTFTMRMHDGTTPMADGLTFVIQGNNPQALGGFAGAIGYGAFGNPGIPNSIAITFDNTNNFGEGPDSTGVFVNGDTPGVPVDPADTIVDLRSTGIDLQSQHVFQVTLSYNGTTLTETITDTVTNATFTHAYTVNIPALVGGNLAYVGFTGGNGFLTEKGDIQTWTYQFTSPIGDEGEQLERPGRTFRSAAGSGITAEMRMLQGPALRLHDQAMDAFFAQFAKKPGGRSPEAASKSLPDVKTAWLRAIEELPAPNSVLDDSPDALFSTLGRRQELLNLFRW
jgi:hypothetical protein